MSSRYTPALAFLAFWLLFLVPFWAPLSMLAGLAFQDDRYSYALAIPFISLGMLYRARKKIFPLPRYSPKTGAALVVIGVSLFWLLKSHVTAGAQTAGLFFTILSIVVVWTGGFVFCYGTKSLGAAIFPICFLLLMAPVPADLLDEVSLVFQKGSAEVVYRLFRFVGVPTFRDGFTFSLPGVTIEVAKECSGIRSSLALLIASIMAGQIFLRSWPNRVWLALLSIPIVIFKNALRIVVLSCLAVYVNPSFLYGRLHHQGGPLFALLALAMLVPLLFALQKREVRAQQGPPMLVSCVPSAGTASGTSPTAV